MSHYEKVKAIVVELGLVPENEDPEGSLFVITDEDRGILNLVVDCEDDIVRLEQVMGLITPETDFRQLLAMNRELVHGAYALGRQGKRIIWIDTLQLSSLDPNELEGSLDALSLAVAEHGEQLVKMLK